MAIEGRIWISNNKGVHLGKGRILLLKLIEEQGSLSKAAVAAKISYRKAWEQIREMNEHSENLLVEMSTGGKGGGSAKLTERAKELIRLYEELEKEHQNFLEAKQKAFERLWK